MKEYDVLIIGAGIFGRVIGRYLKRQGRDVTLFDAGFEQAGSKPAACLMKPSWLTSMSKVEQAQSMAVLDECYGVHEIEAFIQAVAGMGKRSTIWWVAPGSIFSTTKPDNVVKQEVTVVDWEEDYGVPYARTIEKSESLHGDALRTQCHAAKLLVVATGSWCNDILPDYLKVTGLRAQLGAAFTWPCDPNRESRVSVRPWAPYKQLVSLPNRYPGELWVGDGTAVFDLTAKRLDDSKQRCARFVHMQELDEPTQRLVAIEPTVLVGRRPYIRGLGAPAYVQEVKPGLWIATGGAKNGTAGAAWAAHKIASATN